jgi:hypothetical protein
MNMNDNGQDDGTGMDGGTDILGKIEALKSQFVSALDDIAASVGGEEKQEQPGDGTDVPAPEDSAAVTPSPAVPGKKPLFGKRKPSGMMNALGIGG